MKTDIVGYPIHANFNIDRYVHIYELIAIFFPPAALVLYDGLTRLERRIWGAARPSASEAGPRKLAVEEPDVPAPLPKTLGIAATQSLLLGLVFGLEVSDWTARSPASFWPSVWLVAGTYTALVVVASLLGKGFAARLAPSDRMAVVNAVLSPLAILGLYAVSASTAVLVQSSGALVHNPWLPAWAAIGLAGVSEVFIVMRLRPKVGDGEASRRFATRTVTVIAGSALIFFLIAQLPGSLGHLDLFHEGESLGAANLFWSGKLPWRDFFVIHGPLQDIVSASLGFGVFGYSRWGAVAGQHLLLIPLSWICLFALYAYLFRRNWPFMLMIPLLALGLDPGVRFIFLPLLLLILAVYLRRPNPMTGAFFGVSLVAMGILTPEAIPFGACCVAVTVAFDLYYRDPGQPMVTTFKRILWVAGGSAAAGLAWLVFLATTHTLRGFVEYFLIFGPGHRLTGGIPMQLAQGTKFRLAALAPIAALLAMFAYVVSRLRTRRPLTPEDWAMAALALFVLYYYTKFLDRADAHVYEVAAIALPLVAYVGFKAASSVERWIFAAEAAKRAARWTTRYPVSLTLLLAMVAIVVPKWVLPQIRAMPVAFRPVASVPPWLGRLGYAAPDALSQSGFRAISEVLDRLSPGPTPIFDFTNSPALFTFLLNRPSPTRYYDVQMAIPARVQADLVAELRRSRPAIVVFDGPGGLPNWDGVPNPVRHYLVSDYVLRTYHPLAFVSGFQLLARNDLVLPPRWGDGLPLDPSPGQQGMYFQSTACNWGFVPDFFATPFPPSAAGSVPIGLHPASGSTSALTLQLPAGDTLSDFHWLEIDSQTGLGADQFMLTDQPGSPTHAIGFETLDNRPKRILIQVGSCLQWHGYGAASLVLQTLHPEDIAGLRLLR